ncbi:MAG: hypothetical protein R3F20_07480 [Planctomycetota bacterium]
MKLSRNGRIAVARGLWLAVGVMLAWRGLVPHLGNIDAVWLKIVAVVVGLAVGVAKGKFVLAKSARRTKRFIARRPAQDWIWFSVHPVLYLLIPLMIAMGLTVKHFTQADHPEVVVALYLAIAAAMWTGSRGFSAPLEDDGDPVAAAG